MLKLPNRTPNGLVLPKQPNLLAYNYLHRIVAQILEHIGLSNHIETIHSPINIRYVESKPSEVDGRPFASAKWHSDVWNSEPSNTIMVFIPICGNLIKNGIEFCEPDPNEFMQIARVLKDYSEGQHLVKNSKHYNIFLDTEHIYLTDPYLLHRTMKGGSGCRLSLDFRFTTKYKSFTDVDIQPNRYENYIPYEQWKEIGKSKLLSTNLKLDEFEEYGVNKYAGKYTIVNL